MNVRLSNTEEYINQKPTGSLGQVLIRLVPPPFPFLFSPPREPSTDPRQIRCNNVLWITAADKGENGDTKMEG